MDSFQRLLDDLQNFAQIQVHGYSHSKNIIFLLCLWRWDPDPTAPVLGLFGGVHGLERIGSQVVLSLMNTFFANDFMGQSYSRDFRKMRLFYAFDQSPGEFFIKREAILRGVDLMRNAPVDAEGKSTWLVGRSPPVHQTSMVQRSTGRRIASRIQSPAWSLPPKFFQSSRVLTVDFHSGFGNIDRLWLPYAKSTRPFSCARGLCLASPFWSNSPHHFLSNRTSSKTILPMAIFGIISMTKFSNSWPQQRSLFPGP